LSEDSGEQALTDRSGYFVPDPDKLRATSANLRKLFPLASMISVAERQRTNGRRQHPDDSDPEGASLHRISNADVYAMPFLDQALDRAMERYSATPEQIIE
jgi:hypothetical protein